MIFSPLIRIESFGMTMAVLILGAVVVALAIAIPVVALINRQKGRADSSQILQSQADKSEGKYIAERECRKSSDARVSALADELAITKGNLQAEAKWREIAEARYAEAAAEVDAWRAWVQTGPRRKKKA